MTRVSDWAIQLTEQVLGGPPFKIGDRVLHPAGHLVEIMDGQYWGDRGLSNFWYWRRVLENGRLSPVVEHGYGWQPSS